MADRLISELLQKPEDLSATDFELLSAIASAGNLKQRLEVVRAAEVGNNMSGHVAETVKLLRDKTPDAACAYLSHSQRNGGKPLPAVTQALLLAEALSVVESPDAKSSWVKLAESYAMDLQIQSRAANARELATDIASRQLIVQRMQSISPPDGILWQIEATRLLLDQDTTEQAAARAALTMTDILAVAPSSMPAYLLAARAYDRLGQQERVLELCRNAVSHGIVIPGLVVHLAESTSSRDEAVRTARSIVNSREFSDLQRQQGIAVLLQHRDYEFAAQAITRNLAPTPDDSDEFFGQFSTLAIARAHHGGVQQVLGPIESLAPQSDRWFQLWLDVTQVPKVSAKDAATMLQQAKQWLSADQPHRHRNLSIAWRRLAKRSRDSKYLFPAYHVLKDVVDGDSSAEEQMILAGLALQADDQATALRLYQRIAEQHANNTQACSFALNNLAALKLEIPEELTAADTLAVRAYAMLQKPEIIDTLVEVRLRQNRRPEAFQLLHEGLEKWPQNPDLKRLASRMNSDGDRT